MTAAFIALTLNACSDDGSSGGREAGTPDAAAAEGGPPIADAHPDARAHTDARGGDAADAVTDAARDGGSQDGARGEDASDAGRVSTPPEGGAAEAGPDGGHGRSLWNGVDLSEWEGDPMIWRVVDGMIVGSAPSGYLTVNSFLIYKGTVPADFVLTADTWLATGGNSGIQYRSARFDTTGYRIRGYQADMGLNYWGQLAEEAGRGILKGPSAECLAEAGFGKWLAYEIRAAGPNLLHHVDGIECMSYVDTAANRPLTGLVALQYHVPGGFEVRFKNLRIAAL